MMSKTPLITLFLVLAMTPHAVRANESVYTKLDTEKCQTISPEDDEGGGIVMKCPGWRDSPVYFMEGDMRQSILYGAVSAADRSATFESFEPFNHTGGTIEWRLQADGKPIATILRWFIENIDPKTWQPTPKMRGQVLVVSTVAAGDRKSCVVGYVDALVNPDPNTMARTLADTVAGTFRCGIDKADFAGLRGPLAAEPTHVFPEN